MFSKLFYNHFKSFSFTSSHLILYMFSCLEIYYIFCHKLNYFLYDIQYSIRVTSLYNIKVVILRTDNTSKGVG